ncbi:MAG: Ig-like domain-containing protein, partial [Lachnospiraceae bacterium]|nr:Ig-like domain-containing protein [Lachnospiraceae bacterium]
PWILQNCWEYYEYTGDTEYMKKNIYPMMKEEAILYSQLLVDSGVKITLENGTESTRLVSAPAYSPEWGPRTLGNVFENTLIWQLYEDTITASEILGVDADLREEWKEKQSRLAPIEIGDSGQIKEWFNETTVKTDSYNGKHRHMSQLLGLFPGDLISVDNKAWTDAARVSLTYRAFDGSDVRGWGLAQRINSWARIGDGEGAYTALSSQLNDKFYQNLWDTHPPFQIDGNFGYTSGVNEMLMQSNAGYINILPAIPSVWNTGSVDGILARGNFELGIDWTEGKATEVRILSKNGGECVVQCSGIKGNNVLVTDSKGNRITFTADADEEKERISFETVKGETYTIDGFGEGKEDVVRLEAPKNVAASVNANGVTLTWGAVAGADSYNVYRKVNTDFVKINTADVTATTYADADGVNTDEDSRYRVVAVKDGEEGEYSAVVVANTAVAKPKAQVTITFSSEKTVSGTLPAEVQQTEGSSYTLPECEATTENYLFAGWSDGKKTYAANESYTVPKTNVTLTAVWESDAYEKLSKDGWSAKAGSQQNEKGSTHNDGPAENAIDGVETNWWHSNYSDAKKKPVIADPGERNEFTIDFGKTVEVSKFEYVPRTAGNGFITRYRLYYSETEDGDDFVEIGDGGTWAYDTTKKTAEFDTISMRRIQIRATETNGAEGLNKHITAAEFNVYTLKDGVVAPTAILADEEITLATNASGKITASVEPANATYKEIKYESSSPQVVRVSADGTITAGTRTGTATITMTAFGGKTATCNVKVISDVAVERINLERESVTLQPGGEIMLIANIEPYKADRTVVWTSDNEEVARVENGKITAGVSGKAIITATASNGMKATCEVWVVKASEESGDKTELNSKLDELTDVDMSGYTEESIKVYQDALAKAQAVLNAQKPSQPEVDAALEALTASMTGLIKKASAEKLETLRGQIAEAEKKNLSDYKPESTGAFTLALEDAKKLLDKEASEEEVDSALQNLAEAEEKLELISTSGGKKDEKEEIPALGSEIEDGDLKYRVTTSDAVNGTVSVMGAADSAKNKSKLIIPETVTKGNYTFKVTEIDAKAFQKNKKLKNITKEK